MSIFSKLFSKQTPFDLNGITDWHSHILPGVDDGVEDLETSLAILDDYEQAGVKNLWLTPHIMEDMPNKTDDLRRRFDELMAAYKGNINIRLAAENMMDNLFDQRLAKKDFLPIGDRKEMLLVETSYFSAPIRFKEILKEVMSAGYYPLLAHPERYNYINSLKEYKRLKEMGVRFQLNLLSLTGVYGKPAQKKAQDLLKLGMYNAYGSDLHRHAQVEHLKQIKLSKDIHRMISEITVD